MDLLESAIKVLELCSHLVAIARDVDNKLPTDKDVCTAEIWEEISRIAAENAAKPEIQGYSEHD